MFLASCQLGAGWGSGEPLLALESSTSCFLLSSRRIKATALASCSFSILHPMPIFLQHPTARLVNIVFTTGHGWKGSNFVSFLLFWLIVIHTHFPVVTWCKGTKKCKRTKSCSTFQYVQIWSLRSDNWKRSRSVIQWECCWPQMFSCLSADQSYMIHLSSSQSSHSSSSRQVFLRVSAQIVARSN